MNENEVHPAVREELEKDAPNHCGLRMEYRPGWAMKRFYCRNPKCFAFAVREHPGHHKVYRDEVHMARVLKAEKYPSPLADFNFDAWDNREKFDGR